MPKVERAPALAVVAAAMLSTGCAPPHGRQVLQCGRGDPTADKPQSKLWYAHGRWWAWLPSARAGGRVWRRSALGPWRPEVHLDGLAATLPGRADVWTDGDRVVAALVEGRRLAVAALRWDRADERYEPAGEPLVWRERSPIETVTIDRAADGSFWVAYPARARAGRAMTVRRVPPGLASPPGEPVAIGRVAGRDDICAVAALDGGVGVLWSDQKAQRILFRRHAAGAAQGDWSAREVVASGHRTADDHVNFCRPPGGGGLKLLAATKTSLDTTGLPIFSLRVLAAGERWRSLAFGNLTDELDFTRPIVLWVGGRPVALFTCRSPGGGGRRFGERFSVIEMQSFAPDARSPVGPRREVMRAPARLNNVTGPKVAPPGRACLVLASDARGAVYEAFVRPGD